MNNNGHDDNNNSANGADHKDDNIISFSTLANRDRQLHAKGKEWGVKWVRQYKQTDKAEPFLNIPPATKALLAILLCIHLYITIFMDPVARYGIYLTYGFVPSYYMMGNLTSLSFFIGPLTYMFIHGSWLHLIMNSAMLLAFGSGLEKQIGGRRMFLLFYVCSIIAVLIHLALNWGSGNPVIGASGGLSGLFAAVFIMLYDRGMMGSADKKKSLMRFAMIWIVISVLFGVMGSPDGSSVAWIAHIGGFLAGLALYRPITKLKI